MVLANAQGKINLYTVQNVELRVHVEDLDAQIGTRPSHPLPNVLWWESKVVFFLSANRRPFPGEKASRVLSL